MDGHGSRPFFVAFFIWGMPIGLGLAADLYRLTLIIILYNDKCESFDVCLFHIHAITIELILMKVGRPE